MQEGEEVERGKRKLAHLNGRGNTDAQKLSSILRRPTEFKQRAIRKSRL